MENMTMNNLSKLGLAALIVALLFKLGYQKGVDKEIKSLLPKTGQKMNLYRYASRYGFGLKSSKPHFRLNGVPAEVDMYIAKNSVEKEMARFEQKWRAQGFEPTVQAIGNMRVVSAFDEANRLFECTLLLPAPGSNRTMVVPAKLDLGKPPYQGRFKTPVYPNAETVLHLESNDLTGFSENIVQISDASVPAIMGFYKDRLLQQGWQRLDPPQKSFSSQYADQMFFARGTDEQQVFARRMAGENKTFVFVLMHDR
jgi:hypothetical protein